MSDEAGPSRPALRKAKVPLNVVGLLSGGKDSCYNLCHCAKLGHNIVALATLSPPEGKDELDSYMYQTVGHDAVHLIAEAMQLPLYRVTITGTAVNQTSTYGSRLPNSSMNVDRQANDAKTHDETEDLYQLLRLVKTHHPEVNAVSVGAILSNYQRVRVEHVARRADISMVPLSYLWQRNQRELLDEMCAAGMESILIKVAGAGLDERDLGKSLLQMRPKLHRLHTTYEAHICGEGGEYETLTIDCPLFKKRIALAKTTIVSHGEESSAGVYFLTVQKAGLEDKLGSNGMTLDAVTIPPELDAHSVRAWRAVKAGKSDRTLHRHGKHSNQIPAFHPARRRKGRWLAIGHIAAKGCDGSVRNATIDAFDQLVAALGAEQLSTAHLQHVNVYLASQEHFAILNTVYAEYFGVAPPSRACVATDLACFEVDIVLDALALDDGHRYGGQTDTSDNRRSLRRNLHVQSLSHWASANIGPYSQAVDAMGRISIAGQIGLLPTTLELEDRTAEQTILSLQHARRIFEAVLESRAERGQGWIESCICWTAGIEVLPAARAAWLEQDASRKDDSTVDTDDEESDDWDRSWLGTSVKARDVPFAFIVLAEDGLPRGAAVEWQFTAHSGDVYQDEIDATTGAIYDDADDDDDDHKPLLPTASKGTSTGSACQMMVTRKGKSSASIIFLYGTSLEDAQHIDTFAGALHVRVFYTSPVDLDILARKVTSSLSHAAVTFVPVAACFDLDLRPAAAVLVCQGVVA